MGYLTPSYQSELDYDTGIGDIVLTWSAALVDEDDLILLCVEGQGGDGFTTPSGYAQIVVDSTGSGTAHAKGSIYGRRADGTETGVTIADTGDHTSASAHLLRNVDRTTAIASLYSNSFTDTTADTNQRALSCSGTTISPALATGQQFIALQFTVGADNHGGSTDTAAVDGTGWYQKLNLRSAGHTQGSDGSHWTRALRGDKDSTAHQFQMDTVNSMREARMHVVVAAHEYSELTRTATETVTNSDSVSGRQGSFTRLAYDAVTQSEALSQLKTLTRALADALTLSDALTTSLGMRASDALTLADTVTGRILGAVRTATDAVSFSEALSQLKTLFRDVTDSLTFSESAAKVISKLRTATESITFSESLDHLLSGIQAVVTASLASLTSIVTSVKPLTAIKNFITKQDYDVEIESTVEPLTDKTATVESLTDITTEIE